MKHIHQQRKTILSVTNFLHCGDHYLFIHRNQKSASVDFNKLNGIGGKLEPGESYLSCAIRETQEETGFIATPADCKLRVVTTLSGGYQDDWSMCFFSIVVPSLEVPLGMENDEGNLIWMHKDKVLHSEYELVDDLHYLWNDIVGGEQVVFFGAHLNEAERITHHSLIRL